MLALTIHRLLDPPHPALAWLCLADTPLHLAPVSHEALVLGLAEALADALAGGRPMGVRLDDGYRAALTADGPTGLSLSVRRPAGPTILRRQPLDRAITRAVVLSWVQRCAEALPPGAPEAPVLHRAAARLQASTPSDRGEPRQAPAPAVPFGLAPVRLAPAQLAPALSAWLDVLEAAMANPENPVVPRRIALETDTALRVARRGAELERQVVDADGLARSLPVARSVLTLAAQAERLIDGQAGLSGRDRALLGQRATRLGQWAAALLPARRAPSPGRAQAGAASPDRGDGRPLPVGGLFHLAYRRLWRAPTEGLQHAVLVEDEVHLTHAHGLTAVARTTGQARWHAQGWRGLGPGAPGLALDSRGRLHRRDASARWCRPDLPPPRRVTPLHTGDWLLQHDDGLEVVDALSGAPRWAADPAYGRLLGVAQGADGLWILAEDRVLRRLSPSDGAVEIRVPLAGPPSAGPVCDGAHVWILDAQRGRHALWALGPDGGTLWRHDLGEAPLDRPRRLGDLLVVPTGDPGAPRLVALDPITGAVAWRVSIPGGPTPPRLLRAGVRVLAKGLDGSTAAFNADGGDVSWALPPDDPDGVVTHNPPPLACRGIVLVAAATVRAVDPATGRLVHTLDAGGLLPDRIDVWPDGDVLISEREGAAFFALEGHLALVG